MFAFLDADLFVFSRSYCVEYICYGVFIVSIGPRDRLELLYYVLIFIADAWFYLLIALL